MTSYTDFKPSWTGVGKALLGLYAIINNIEQDCNNAFTPYFSYQKALGVIFKWVLVIVHELDLLRWNRIPMNQSTGDENI